MYIDLVILVLIIILVVFFFKRFSSFVYAICAIDILYRLLHFLADNVNVPELQTLINKYIPASITSMIGSYVDTSGLLYTLIVWCMFILYCIFLFYIIRILFRRR